MQTICAYSRPFVFHFEMNFPSRWKFQHSDGHGLRWSIAFPLQLPLAGAGIVDEPLFALAFIYFSPSLSSNCFSFLRSFGFLLDASFGFSELTAARV